MKNYTVVPFDTQNDDLLIIGYLYQPETEGPHDCVVMCHGIYDDLNNNTDIAEALASKGMVVINFDFNNEQSSTAKSALTTKEQLADLESVLEKAKQSKDLKNIYLIGIANGGYISAVAAKKEESDVAKLVLMNPELTAENIDLVKGYMNPTLLFYSNDNQSIPANYLEKVSEIYPDCNVVKVDDGKQGFTGQAKESIIEDIVNFLEK